MAEDTSEISQTLTVYIDQCRDAGMSDKEIENNLLDAGHPQETIHSILYKVKEEKKEFSSLVEYIKTCRELGHSEDAIKDLLLDAGHNTHTVAALLDLEEDISTPDKKNQEKKKEAKNKNKEKKEKQDESAAIKALKIFKDKKDISFNTEKIVNSLDSKFSKEGFTTESVAKTALISFASIVFLSRLIHILIFYQFELKKISFSHVLNHLLNNFFFFIPLCSSFIIIPYIFDPLREDYLYNVDEGIYHFLFASLLPILFISQDKTIVVELTELIVPLLISLVLTLFVFKKFFSSILEKTNYLLVYMSPLLSIYFCSLWIFNKNIFLYIISDMKIIGLGILGAIIPMLLLLLATGIDFFVDLIKDLKKAHTILLSVCILVLIPIFSFLSDLHSIGLFIDAVLIILLLTVIETKQHCKNIATALLSHCLLFVTMFIFLVGVNMLSLIS